MTQWTYLLKCDWFSWIKCVLYVFQLSANGCWNFYKPKPQAREQCPTGCSKPSARSSCASRGCRGRRGFCTKLPAATTKLPSQVARAVAAGSWDLWLLHSWFDLSHPQDLLSRQCWIAIASKRQWVTLGGSSPWQFHVYAKFVVYLVCLGGLDIMQMANGKCDAVFVHDRCASLEAAQ